MFSFLLQLEKKCRTYKKGTIRVPFYMAYYLKHFLQGSYPLRLASLRDGINDKIEIL